MNIKKRDAARAPPRRPPPPVGSATLPSATQPLELAPVIGQVREYEALDADCPPLNVVPPPTLVNDQFPPNNLLVIRGGLFVN